MLPKHSVASERSFEGERSFDGIANLYACERRACGIRTILGRRKSKTAMDFEREIREAFAELSEAPLRYPTYSGTTRVKVLSKFPFSIFYRVKPGEVEILAIAHNARRPNFWKADFED